MEGAGGEWEEMESCARFRPATAMSELAIKPDGVRVVVEDSFSHSAARERSRRALALSLFSSWGLLDVPMEDEGLTHYSPRYFWC